MSNLPGIAGEIEEAIGLDLAVKLLEARGGTEIVIPVRATGTALAEIIGAAAAEKVIAEIGSGKVLLPCASMRGEGARRARAIELLRSGQSLRAVALECDIHIRTVSRYRAQIDAEAADLAQPGLPFDN
ncbi:MAG: helix-turn-helix domain-containing protein [Rhodobacteraceae bacterium]|nr:helix-turn-helix domain-containing protein [Paracoccaceae bacterium]MCW9041723.1 helix-turn-helix domain-containing protein [Pseudopelagicola sp.]